MTSTESAVVEQSIRIEARPETIFPFFTDPEKMVKWKGTEATLDARPGGVYLVNVTGRDIARGEYVEITPYTRVVFTWGWEGDGSPVPPGSSTVEITLKPDGKETVVTLRHSGIPAPAAGEHEKGWTHYIARLGIAAAGGDPGPDPMVGQKHT